SNPRPERRRRRVHPRGHCRGDRTGDDAGIPTRLARACESVRRWTGVGVNRRDAANDAARRQASREAIPRDRRAVKAARDRAPASFGGELEIDTWPAATAGTSRARAGWCSVATGRTALFLAARAARSLGPRPALLPSYICDSAVRAVRAAGMPVRY